MYPSSVSYWISRKETTCIWHARVLEGGRDNAVTSRTAVEVEFQPAETEIISKTAIEIDAGFFELLTYRQQLQSTSLG